MANKQTSVEWLEEKIINYDFNQGMAQMRKYILQAKEMHKEQIKIGYAEGVARAINRKTILSEEYYNETYGKS